MLGWGKEFHFTFHFTLPIHAKLSGLSSDLAVLPWIHRAVCSSRYRATALRKTFAVSGYATVSMWLCGCTACASALNWRNRVETIMHLGSFCRSHKITWRSTFGRLASSLTHALSYFVCGIFYIFGALLQRQLNMHFTSDYSRQTPDGWRTRMPF